MSKCGAFQSEQDPDSGLRIVSYLSSHLASIHRNWYPPHKFVQRLHVGSVHGLRGIVMPLTRNGSAVPGDRCSTIHSFGNVAPRSGSEALDAQPRYADSMADESTSGPPHRGWCAIGERYAPAAAPAANAPLR